MIGPTLSRAGQLTIVVPYVTDQGPDERFLAFLELDVGGHTGAALAMRVLDFYSANRATRLLIYRVYSTVEN